MTSVGREPPAARPNNLRLFLVVAAGACVVGIVAIGVAELVLASQNSRLGAGSKAAWGIDGQSPDQKRELQEVALRAGAGFDMRDHIELLADLRRDGVDAVPAIMLGGIVSGNEPLIRRDAHPARDLLPLGGISNAVTLLCNESGQPVVYRSDEHGFRNPAGTWISRHAQLAVVGESYAQGYCVPDGAGFVDRLRARYGVTLNLGISGGAPLMQLAAIREYLPDYAPQRVLWVFSEGIDLADVADEARHPWLMRYLDPSFTQHLQDRQREIDDTLRAFAHEQERKALERRTVRRLSTSHTQQWLGHFKLWDLREKIQLTYGIPSADPPDAAFDVFRQAITEADRSTKQWGGRLYFVYLPSWNRFRNGPVAVERERRRVFELVKALSIPVVDVRTAFERSPDPLSLFPFRRFGHYNERGNELVASTVLAFISADEQMRRAGVSDRRSATQ